VRQLNHISGEVALCKLTNARSMIAPYKADMLPFIHDKFDVVMKTE